MCRFQSNLASQGMDTPARRTDQFTRRNGKPCEVLAGDTVDTVTWDYHVTALDTLIAPGLSHGDSSFEEGRPHDPHPPFTIQGRIDEPFSQRHSGRTRARVQDVLANHPLVAMAAVVGTGTAHIVAQAGTSLDWRDLHLRCLNHLPRRLVPDDFVFQAALPLLPTGKIDRQALVER